MRRQASEQYFTSAQLRAQRRRQLIARPQTAQGLLGKAALLPRNPAFDAIAKSYATWIHQGRAALSAPALEHVAHREGLLLTASSAVAARLWHR